VIEDLFNRANAASALFHGGFVQTLGVMAGPVARRCLALLAAAQIDRRGNINSSRSGDGRFIVGSGGANRDGLLEVTGLICEPGAEGATRAEIASRCGDDLPVSSDLTRFDPPSDEELELLRSFDPQRANLA
jgi:hypothetical protein